MPSDECHIHWNTFSAFTEINCIEQDLELTAGDSGDPLGTVRVRAAGETGPGLAIPTMGWEAVPGTSPALEARADALDPVGYIRVRVA